MNKKLALVMALVLVLGVSASALPVGAASVSPVYVPGNPTCADLGYPHGIKIDPPNPGTYPLGLGTFTWTGSVEDGWVQSWSSTFGVDAVMVKGGPGANVYYYNPESFGDTDLYAPINPGGQRAGISHIDVCFDYEVLVRKSANTSYTRTYAWRIAKGAEKESLTLSLGQQYLMNYWVTVDAAYTDSDWAVSGTIRVRNPDPDYPAIITGITDVVSPDIAAEVVCPVTFPYSLAPLATLDCTYHTALPDGSTRRNTATVTTASESKVGGGSVTVGVVFGAPTTEVDKCVIVYDKHGDADEVPIGRVCYPDVPKTFPFSRWIGPYWACGTYQVTDVARYLTNTTGTSGRASWTVTVNVPCGGCTLTQGYWKTHSKYGPAPYDDTWALLGEDTPFFLSGKSYYQVLWTSPSGGNAYFILAHQYIAAVLNGLNGAYVPPAVQAAINQAAALFNTYTPDQVAGMKGKAGTDLRAQFIALAYTLDRYNNGYMGTPHCSE